MQKVRVDLGERSYSISIGSGTLADIGSTLARFEFSRKLALISNPTVYGLYGSIVSQSVRDAGYDLVEVLIPDGEEYKNLGSMQTIYGELLRTRLDRKSALIALGGGVIGDITGFAASTYMRGIDFVQVPTTLLAQVDSSVGGKTGVNHLLGKNMIGTFWQPRFVWIDTSTLKTLPEREFLAGLSEVIKYGIIWDAELFSFLEEHREAVLSLQPEALTRIIGRSCEIKAEVVSKDERESGLRAILNFGHTVGHALETVTGYKKYLHGEAIAVGMHLEAKLSARLGMIGPEAVARIERLLLDYGLPAAMPEGTDADSIIAAMQIDKKAVSGEIRIVLPEAVGSVKVRTVASLEDIRKILA